MINNEENLNSENTNDEVEKRQVYSSEETPESIAKGEHSKTLEAKKDESTKEQRRLIINKETGKIVNAETGEEVTEINMVTEDGKLGSVSAGGRIILCGANAYEQKYYFNPLFSKIPESIQKELNIICVLFTQSAGGVFTIEFEDDGEITMETNVDEDDITYDEIAAGLLIGEIRRKRQELFESLQMYYRIYILHENPGDILTEEDE